LKLVHERENMKIIDRETWQRVEELQKDGMSYGKIAKQLNIKKSTVDSHFHRLKENRIYAARNEIDLTEATNRRKRIETKTEMVGDTKIVTSTMLLEINDMENKTPQDIMILHGYDPLAWEVLAITNKAWNGTSKDQGSYTMFSSSLKVKPIEMQLDSTFIKQCFNDLTPKVWDVKCTPKTNTDLFAEVCIFDIHAGKLAWDEETGNNYDLSIMSGIVERIIGKNVEYLAYIKPSMILFPIGNDLFQTDNDADTTFHGTPQDTDSRHKKVFKAVIDLMFDAVSKLSCIAPVKLLLIPGNHDATTSYYLAEVLEKAFSDNPNVETDTSPKSRKYYAQGKVLIGYTHSDEESKKELNGLMAKEVPELWGKSKFREMHFGHIHIETVEECNGLKKRWIPSISGADKWHYGKGYTETDRTSQTFIWDEQQGLQSINYFR